MQLEGALWKRDEGRILSALPFVVLRKLRAQTTDLGSDRRVRLRVVPLGFAEGLNADRVLLERIGGAVQGMLGELLEKPHQSGRVA